MSGVQFVPQPVDRTGHAAHHLPARRNWPWEWMHHPINWDVGTVDGEPTWLPRLSRFAHQPGVNGVAQDHRTKTVIIGPARRRYQDNGWHFIPYDAGGIELPGGFGEYVVRYRCRDGWFYADVFMSPRVMGAGATARLDWDLDLEAFNRFRAALVVRGVVPAVTPQAIELRMRVQRRRARRGSQSSNAAAVAKSEAETAKADAWGRAVILRPEAEALQPQSGERRVTPRPTRRAAEPAGETP